eukprot:CAMPEP_0174314030 /NCGR_PEP_ID=MMETSP0810-20121108/5382_1 /TAXON_ID=73025 ORGANISM="Eutreptiella gymnastica-like, Strain CCMP1594" /NCGR_SAMPLE_ID=MMETSP0810 /ASSEMBLY_ACC=CAM_ASM_000659 /LENGTH=42 /DNA_ID= /DNA_START= /DNA_END= /DNA_ORIENTATION=
MATFTSGASPYFCLTSFTQSGHGTFSSGSGAVWIKAHGYMWE